MNEGEGNFFPSALRVTRFGFTTAPATERISQIRHRLLANFVYMLGTAFTVLIVRIHGSRSLVMALRSFHASTKHFPSITGFCS